MSEKISGGCLCGAVTYEVENDFNRFYFCHCQQCRKITGSAHASNLFTRPDAIQWTTGATYKKQFNYPERDFTVVFCTECGSGLPFVTTSGKVLIVPAGSLDAEPNIQPNDNIFWAERAAWYDEGTHAHKCDGFPR
ncbi:GFA family protein [uncultured Paraglaciecola sp.]|uniref:GFA family protein n=1 Tax=uncultured Paraglaciecola sp. TaxID=1765024 RepID=UPI0030DA8F23|tara:strand:+ start:123542 stop:123949 length:408 start_codon:yes stop_codon:yes gene_type:complete